MSLLHDLLKNNPDSGTPANLANHANLSRYAPTYSHDSHDSQGGATRTIHAHLVALADAEGLDPALVHHLAAADLQACDGLPYAALVAYLHALDDTATRNAGIVPATYTAQAHCRGCGPAWLPPETLAGLDTSQGPPLVNACPWCHTTPPPGHRIPRPHVTSATCNHWKPDSVNPRDGMGRCKCGASYPRERHHCLGFQPRATHNGTSKPTACKEKTK